MAALPLFLLVENGLSEAAFLRTAMPAVWRRKIKEWERVGSIRFEHGGGIGEMARVVDHFCFRGGSNPLALSPDAWRACHFLLSDRDSANGNDQPSKDVAALIRACKRGGMDRRLHVLRRRNQEAYLPYEAMELIVRTKTGAANVTQGLSAIAPLRSDPSIKHHNPLPLDWFKNAFLEFSERINWEASWFADDGSEEEMVTIAEAVASFM